VLLLSLPRTRIVPPGAPQASLVAAAVAVDERTMRALSLFSGAGGMDLGLEAAGIRTVALCEIMTHARVVLRHRFPGIPPHDDVTTFDGTQFRGLVDLVHGGSPCQDLSVAGKRAGLTGSRSSLFHHQVRIWEESEAPMILWENVPGAFSSNGGRDFATVLSSLVGAAIPVPQDGWRSGGVAAGRSAVAAWRVLDAQYFGVPQRRSRVFVLGVRAGGPDPAEILALAESLRRDTPQGRAPGQDAAARTGTGVEVAGSLGGGSGVRGFCDDLDRSGAFPVQIAAPIAFHPTQDPISDAERSPALGATTGGMGVLAIRTAQTSANGHGVADNVAHTLDQAQGQAVLAFDAKQSGESAEGVAPTLRAMPHDASHANAGGQLGVLAFDTTQVTSKANRSNPQAGDPCHPLAAGAHPPAVVPILEVGKRTGKSTDDPRAGIGIGHDGDPMYSLQAGAQHGVTAFDGYSLNASEVHHTLPAQKNGGDHVMIPAAIPRRLTPTECERLMSWPDGHTAIGITEKGNTVHLADGARYKLCGNGVASVCAQWIGERIMQAWTALRREEAA
jgi:DNA (cytosine-5)-methyltransferase 1